MPNYKQYRNGKDSKHVLTEKQFVQTLLTLHAFGGESYKIGDEVICDSADGDQYIFTPTEEQQTYNEEAGNGLY